MENTSINGDCLEVMPNLPESFVDLILCDLPYSQTSCVWDKAILDPAELWKNWKRILKPGGTVILTTSGKFNIIMGASNLEWLQYDLIWKKPQATNPMHISKRPGKAHENILVFCEGTPYYNPQMTQGTPYKGFESKNGATIGEAYGSGKSKHRDNPTGERFPLSVVEFGRERSGPKHPTKKPLKLCEFLIKTFSKEGDIVFDCCSGVGSIGKAAKNTNRKYFLIEKEKSYYDIGVEWINSTSS